MKRIKLAVMADKMRIPRGKGKILKDRWYNDPEIWKHCRVPGCKLVQQPRFKAEYRFHKYKYHKKVDLSPEA